MADRPHTLRRSWPRWIGRAAALLIAGLVISIAVAWGCALWMPPDSSTMRVFSLPQKALGWIEESRGNRGYVPEPQLSEVRALHQSLVELPDEEWKSYYTALTRTHHEEDIQIQTSSGVDFVSLRNEGAVDPVYQTSVRRLRAGWPWKCVHAQMAHWRSKGADGPFDWYGIVEVPRSWASGNPASTLRGRLPWLPEWSGLIANTLFYASILWFFAFGLGFIRRARRRAKGRCVFCNYSLTGLAPGASCPECGAVSSLASQTNATTPPSSTSPS